MFVYIVGNLDQKVFKLGAARDPFRDLAGIQSGNPFELSIISTLPVKNKNAAAMIESLCDRDLKAHKSGGDWLVNVPDDVCEQFVNGHYLRSLARRVGIKIIEKAPPQPSAKEEGLGRLTAKAKRQELTLEDIFEKVETAYQTGKEIDLIL